MLIEMLMLSWLARTIYTKPEEQDEDVSIIETYVVKNNTGQTEITGNNELPNLQLPLPIATLTSEEVKTRTP